MITLRLQTILLLRCNRNRSPSHTMILQRIPHGLSLLWLCLALSTAKAQPEADLSNNAQMLAGARQGDTEGGS